MLLSLLILAATPAQQCLDAAKTDDVKRAVELCSKLLPPKCAEAFRAGKGDRCAAPNMSGPEIRAQFREWLKTDELLAAFDVLDQKRSFPFSVRSCAEPALAAPIFDTRGATQADRYLHVLREAKPAFEKCQPIEPLQRGVFVRFTVAPSGRVCRVAGVATTEGQKCLARQLERLAFPPPEGGGIVEMSYPLNVDAR